ncbi:MAG: carboxymuconolactone decarboxylase family protein [Deltaproteobacteria bacterium]|nr:carboxymuconolactone decarboxylase family protein [Deltaproteobacteria bacterium]
MARIPPVDRSKIPPEVEELFQEQEQSYGTVLESSLIMAHCPSILMGYRALRAGVTESGLIPVPLKALINVRVASINGCPF